MPPEQRQTQTYLRNLFQERRLRPKNKLGQNFLVDLNLMDLILRSAELNRTDLVLEVGTGTGSLTWKLAEAAGAILSVEIDPDFHRLAGESLGHLQHVRLIHADVLKNKNQLNPEVLDQVRAGLEKGQFGALKLVANLPYAVATPVISNLLLSNLPLERMVVTVQWEIGERLAAVPGTSPYGALSVLVQSLADVEILRRLAPNVFWPRPEVESAIVLIRPNPKKRERFDNPLEFRNFLRDLYAHRRKNLRGGLLAFPGNSWNKPQLDQELARLGIAGSERAEDLNLESHFLLFQAFGKTKENEKSSNKKFFG